MRARVGLQSRRCIYCGNAGEDFVAAAPDVDRPQRRVDLCGRCGAYTKVIGADTETPFPLLAVEDLASLDLDRGAMSRDYRRPPLRDLDAIEPLSSTC
jgi:formate dehydrogenase maturation protein FdhE